jgi:hypothetical protein
MTLIDPQRHALIAGGTRSDSQPKPVAGDPFAHLPIIDPPFGPLPSPL